MEKTAIELRNKLKIIKELVEMAQETLNPDRDIPCDDQAWHQLERTKGIFAEIDAYLSSPPSERAKELVKQIMSLVAFGDFEEMVGPDLDVAARDIEAFRRGDNALLSECKKTLEVIVDDYPRARDGMDYAGPVPVAVQRARDTLAKLTEAGI